MIQSQDRSGYIGASDTSMVVGNWNRKTFEKWWLEKLGLNKNDIKISFIILLINMLTLFVINIIFGGNMIPIYVMLPYFIFLIIAIFSCKIIEEIVDNFLRDENYKIMTFEEFNYKYERKKNEKKNIKWLI